MNVLISSYVHWWNAEAAYAAALASALLDNGHKAWVLTQPGTRNEKELLKRGLPVRTDFRLRSSNPFILARDIIRLRAFQKKEAIDVVNVFHPREMAWHLLAVGGKHGPRLVRTRGTARPARGHWLNRALYGRWCDGVIASSEGVKRQLISDLSLPQEPGREVRTIYYPIDTPPEMPRKLRADLRRALLSKEGLAENTRLLGMVGRIAPEKGYDQLVQALQHLAIDHPDVVLLIMDKGYEDEGPRKIRLKQKIDELGVTSNIRWLGFRNDVRQVMGLVDVGVIPSLASETNCRVAVEFFSVGVPVVAFPTGALPEVVAHGQSGLVTDKHDPMELAGALRTLLDDEALRNTMGAEARKQAQTRFSMDRFLADTLECYQQALGHK